MSAITETEFNYGPDRIRRLHTTCRVWVHSHENNKKDLSQDVIHCTYTKNITGIGGASLVLTASRNYMNEIHPNDYINIYINIGDDEGFTRVFFGFIDTITEKYTVDPDGSPTVRYILQCSDFQKAFEKTQIYFNPYMSGRKDFGGEQFGVINIGGVALLTSGVRAYGSPANIIQNLITLLFGFGSQFILPPEYATNTEVIQSNRNSRRKFLLGELGYIARAAIATTSSFDRVKQQIDAEAGRISSEVTSFVTEEERIRVLKDKYKISSEVFRLDVNNESDIRKFVFDQLFRTRIGAAAGSGNELDPAVIQALTSLDDMKQPSLLDIIDGFSLFEDETIDGWVTDTGIWTNTGPIAALLRNYSNEDINEFFFDLRPVVEEEDTSGLYSRRPDEVEGNITPETTGIKYVPSIVMREYPFGTISRIDGSDIQFSIGGDLRTNNNLKYTLGTVDIGALFSHEINRPGRHTIYTPSQNLALLAYGQTKASAKNLDVAVISVKEIMSSDLSRSDSDHFNLFELWAGDFQLQDIKWMMAEILPIITPIHVMRHGLRVRSRTTRFAQFNLAVIQNRSLQNSRILSKAQQLVFDPGVVPVPPEEPEGFNSASLAVTQALPGSLVLPIDDTGSAGYVTSSYGYRPKLNNSVTSVAQAGGTWVFHNGVDIKAPIGTPVKAVMDGVIVASVPNGVFTFYGETIIIKHIDPNGRTIYTQYSHLGSRVYNTNNVSGFNKAARVAGMSSSILAGGLLAEIPVKAGDIIGTVGVTSGILSNPLRTHSGAHLHFEFLTGVSKNVYPALNKTATPDIPITSVGEPRPTGTNPRSEDPQTYLASFGVVLRGAGFDPEVADVDAGETDPDVDTINTTGPMTISDPSADILDTTNIAETDNIDTRRHILRWGLLQDHWYQHNLEYLSGTITMRGAPEIRPGYRLDIQETNMSFYVDGVNFSWSVFDKPITTLIVSRGQCNNPFPMYVMPPIASWVNNPGTQRGIGSRLSKFMLIPDPLPVQTSIVFRSNDDKGSYITNSSALRASTDFNITDAILHTETETFLKNRPDIGTAQLHPDYGDYVLHAETTGGEFVGIDLESDSILRDILSPLEESESAEPAALDKIPGQYTKPRGKT